MAKDALDELIVKEPSNLNKLLADILRGYIKFTEEGKLLFEPEFYSLQGWKRILLACLGKKALHIKNLIENEEIGLKELSEAVSEQQNNITKYVSRNLKGVVQRSSKKGYFVPNYNLLRCKKLIEEKTSKRK